VQYLELIKEGVEQGTGSEAAGYGVGAAVNLGLDLYMASRGNTSGLAKHIIPDNEKDIKKIKEIQKYAKDKGLILKTSEASGNKSIIKMDGTIESSIIGNKVVDKFWANRPAEMKDFIAKWGKDNGIISTNKSLSVKELNAQYEKAAIALESQGSQMWLLNGGAKIKKFDKQSKTTSDFLAKAVELGFPANAKYGDYSQDQVAKINKSLFDDQIKLAAAKAMSVRVGVDLKGEEAFAKGLGELDAKAVSAARDKRDVSIAALNSLKQLNTLNQNDLISGSFATGRVGATNLLASLGLASGKDVDKLASSENYQKVAGDVILSTLGGRLGAGFSNEDRKFIQSLVPQLENSALARKQLIEFMTKKNQDIVTETSRMEDYARKNRTLNGFVPTIPVVNLPSANGKPLSQMSTQELQDLRSKLMKR